MSSTFFLIYLQFKAVVQYIHSNTHFLISRPNRSGRLGSRTAGRSGRTRWGRSRTSGWGWRSGWRWAWCADRGPSSWDSWAGSLWSCWQRGRCWSCISRTRARCLGTRRRSGGDWSWSWGRKHIVAGVVSLLSYVHRRASDWGIRRARGSCLLDALHGARRRHCHAPSHAASGRYGLGDYRCWH